MKVFSIAFQAVMDPKRIALYTTSDVQTPEEALKLGIEAVKDANGDLAWNAIVANAVEVKPEGVKEVIREVKVETPLDPSKETKNWALNMVVVNSDKKLFNALKPYLSTAEISFIKDKLQ